MPGDARLKIFRREFGRIKWIVVDLEIEAGNSLALILRIIFILDQK
jgi:hypothetical protein